MLSRINLTSVFLSLLMLVAIIIQANLLPYLSIDQAVLNIILIIITLLIFQNKNLLALYLSIFAGLVLDINFGIGFGPYLISFLFVLGFLYLLQNMVLKEEALVFYIILIFLGTIFFDSVLIAMINVFGYQVSILQFWQIILKEIAYNVSIAIIIFGLYSYYLKKYFPSSRIKLSERL